MEPIASRRTIQLHMSSTRLSAATRALIDSTYPGLELRPCCAGLCHTVPTGFIRSRPLTYRYPRGFGKPGLGFACVTAVYVEVLQAAPLIRSRTHSASRIPVYVMACQPIPFARGGSSYSR
jgi:hypothetical protein